MKKLPLVRKDNIIEQESDQELLLYDLKSNKAFCLNPTAVIIYRHCDGKTEIEELVRRFGMNEELITLALQKFEMENLLKEPTDFHSIPRRQLLIKASTSALALPFITVLVSPTSVQAASCVNAGGAAPGAIVNVCVGPVANCALACQSPAVAGQCCSGMSGLGLCGASCNCVCVG